MYTQRRNEEKRARLAWMAALAAVCVLVIWIAAQIGAQGRDAYPAGPQLPRNMVDMHGTYRG